MHLGESEGLLGESARYFACVYEHFQFKEEQPLKGYLDFIVHEPVEWLKAFPEKLKTKSSFAKPKSALIKLLKHERVIQDLGSEYVKHVHDTVWTTFKKHGDAILLSRQPVTNTIEHIDVDEYECESEVSSVRHPHLNIKEVEDDDTVSIHTVPLLPPPTVDIIGQRNALLSNLVRTLVSDYEGSCPALVSVTLQLLDALEKS